MEKSLGPLSRKHSHEPREYRGYALQAAVRLEAAHPGYLLASFHAAPLKRQAQFAALSEIDLIGPEQFVARLEAVAPEVMSGLGGLDSLAKIARALVVLRAKPIIQATFGTCPPGLLGLLARVGASPLDPRSTYRVAHSLYADPRHRRRAAILKQISGEVSAGKIAVVAALDEVVAHKAVVDRLYEAGDQVAGVHRFVAEIRALCDADDHAIRASLDTMPAPAGIHGLSPWVQGWMRRQARLPVAPPVPADDRDLRLRFGADLVDLARRYQNCTGQRLSYPFLGERAYVEWIGQPGPEAVIELQRVRDGDRVRWMVEEVRAKRNRKASDEALAAIRAKLVGYGVLIREAVPRGPGSSGLRRLVEHWTCDEFAATDEDEQAEPQTAEQVLADLDRLVNGDAAEAA